MDDTQERSSSPTAGRHGGPGTRPEDAPLWLAALVNSSDDAIFSKTLDGVITSWNTAAQQIYGYSAEEIIGKSVSLLIPPERLDEFKQIMRRLRQGERIDHFETVRVGRDGRRIEVSLTISPIIDAQGQIIGASTIGRDITARKQAEAERGRLLAALKESRHLFQRIAETIPDYLHVSNIDTGRPTYVSPRCEQVTGYTAEQLMGLEDRITPSLIHPDDLPAVKEHLRRHLELADGEQYDSEYRMLHSDGTYHWLHSLAASSRVATTGRYGKLKGCCERLTSESR